MVLLSTRSIKYFSCLTRPPLCLNRSVPVQYIIILYGNENNVIFFGENSEITNSLGRTELFCSWLIFTCATYTFRMYTYICIISYTTTVIFITSFIRNAKEKVVDWPRQKNRWRRIVAVNLYKCFPTRIFIHRTFSPNECTLYKHTVTFCIIYNI